MEAADACGNSDEHTMTVTFHDTSPPAVDVLPPLHISAECDFVYDAPSIVVNTTGDCLESDTSTIVPPSWEFRERNCSNHYIKVVLYTVYDTVGNSNEMVTTIVVQDLIPPAFTPPLPENMTVQCEVPPFHFPCWMPQIIAKGR